MAKEKKRRAWLDWKEEDLQKFLTPSQYSDLNEFIDSYSHPFAVMSGKNPRDFSMESIVANRNRLGVPELARRFNEFKAQQPELVAKRLGERETNYLTSLAKAIDGFGELDKYGLDFKALNAKGKDDLDPNSKDYVTTDRDLQQLRNIMALNYVLDSRFPTRPKHGDRGASVTVSTPNLIFAGSEPGSYLNRHKKPDRHIGGKTITEQLNLRPVIERAMKVYSDMSGEDLAKLLTAKARADAEREEKVSENLGFTAKAENWLKGAEEADTADNKMKSFINSILGDKDQILTQEDFRKVAKVFEDPADFQGLLESVFQPWTDKDGKKRRNSYLREDMLDAAGYEEKNEKQRDEAMELLEYHRPKGLTDNEIEKFLKQKKKDLGLQKLSGGAMFPHMNRDQAQEYDITGSYTQKIPMGLLDKGVKAKIIPSAKSVENTQRFALVDEAIDQGAEASRIANARRYLQTLKDKEPKKGKTYKVNETQAEQDTRQKEIDERNDKELAKKEAKKEASKALKKQTDDINSALVTL